MKSYNYIELKVPAQAQFVGVARLTISAIANRIGFSYDEIEDLKIATSEAITNSIQHAYKENEQGEVVIGIALYEEKMEVMVSDYGRSFNFEETKKLVGPYHENDDVLFLREGGLGLYLIESLMDEVKIHHKEGVTVLMTKYRGGKQVDQDVEPISP